MKDVLIGSIAILIVLLIAVFAADKTIDCDKIPKNQRYKYAVLSDNIKKCVRMSDKEIRENRIEELQEENEELKQKLWGMDN